jgi:hypothetical protein
VALVRTDVSQEGIASIIKVTIIGELGTTLPVTSNRRLPPKLRFLQEPQGVTSEKATFFATVDYFAIYVILSYSPRAIICKPPYIVSVLALHSIKPPSLRLPNWCPFS